MAKKRKRYVPGGSSGALSMTAAAAPKQDPYRFIRDGKKQQVAGRANLPTARQKDLASYVLPHQDSITAIRKGEAGAMEYGDVALSAIPGLAAVKPIVKGAKNMGIFKKAVEKGTDLVGDASAYLKKNKGTPPKPPKTPKSNVSRTAGSERPATDFGEKGVMKGIDKQWNKGAAKQRASDTPIRRPDETSGPTIRAGNRLGGATPAVRGSTTPAATTPKPKPKPTPTTSKSKPKPPPTDTGTIVGLSPLGKGVLGGALAGGTAAYLTQSEKDAKPAAGSQATKNKAPYVEGYDMDMDDFDSPKPSYPKRPKAAKSASKKDDGYRYYGKKGTGLGDFSRKFEIKYATPEQFEKDFGMDDGEKRGGRPGKSKMKTQGLNRSKRSGFSGRGTGAALRGF